MTPHRILVTATLLEAELLLDHLPIPSAGGWIERRNCLTRELEPYGAWLGVTGMGPVAAEEGLEEMLTLYPGPAAVVGFGFAGGLIRTAETGNLVVPKSVRWQQAEMSPDPTLFQVPTGSFNREPQGQLLTVDQLVSTPAEKAALYAATSSQAVDMESGVWGEICRNQKIHWGIVRVILDTADESIPNELSALLDRWGRPKWIPSISLFIRKPGLLKTAWKFAPHRLANVAQGYVGLLNDWLASSSPRSKKTDLGDERPNAG